MDIDQPVGNSRMVDNDVGVDYGLSLNINNAVSIFIVLCFDCISCVFLQTHTDKAKELELACLEKDAKIEQTVQAECVSDCTDR